MAIQDAFSYIQPQPGQQSANSAGTSWLDDSLGWFSDVVDTTGSAISNFYDSWLNDSLGNSGSPERARETPQGRNADISNSPPVAFGFSRNQLLIAGAASVALFFLVKR